MKFDYDDLKERDDISDEEESKLKYILRIKSKKTGLRYRLFSSKSFWTNNKSMQYVTTKIR